MTTSATISVCNLRPINSKTIYALVDADIEIAGVGINVFGIQARHLADGGTSIHLPTFRDSDGVWRSAVGLPDEIREAICDAVLAFMVEEGLARKVVADLDPAGSIPS